MIDSGSPRKPGEIIYHFDVERGSIPLAQFVDTARATQEIIDDFNKSLFDEKLRYELRVKTPEEGSLIEVLAVVVTVGGSILAFLGTDIGKAFFKGLTTEEPASWAEKVGKNIREALTKPEPIAEADRDGALVEIGDAGRATALEASIPHHVEAEAIALILIRFLEIDIERLKAIGITPEKFRAAFQGRNRVFKACIDNPEVKAITFDRESDFDIKRSDFPRHITQLPDPPPEEPPETTDWSIETVDIVVNSPNWKRDGRKWQAATNKHQDIAFSVEDDRFWFSVERKDIQPDIRDNMRVQWAYPAGLSKPVSVRVLRVLNYNGKPISAALSEAELQALLTTVHFVEPDMPDLFDERRGSKDKNDKGDA
jgi:hypothetical protein